MHSFARALFVVILGVLPLSAFADIPPLNESYAEIAYEGGEDLSLLTVPDGSGNPFTEAYLPNGITVDATVTLHLLDYNLDPIPDFPREDLWLRSEDGGLIPCQGALTADENTGDDGTTRWSAPVSAGGWSEGYLQVYISGDPLYMSPPLKIRTNSPDINGDLTVNLADLGMFSIDFFGAYHYRSDFYCDGNLNLADVGKFAHAIGVSCP